MIECRKQSPPLVVLDRGDADHTVAAGKQSRRRDVTSAAGPSRAPMEHVCAFRQRRGERHCLLHRHVDEHRAGAVVAPIEAVQRRQGGDGSRRLQRHIARCRYRCPVGPLDRGEQTTGRLSDELAAGLRRPRPVESERADRGDDRVLCNRWRDCPALVDDHDVVFLDQCREVRRWLDDPLAAVKSEVHGRNRSGGGPDHRPSPMRCAGTDHLRRFRTEAGQQRSGDRTGDPIAELKHPHTRQERRIAPSVHVTRSRLSVSG